MAKGEEIRSTSPNVFKPRLNVSVKAFMESDHFKALLCFLPAVRFYYYQGS